MSGRHGANKMPLCALWLCVNEADVTKFPGAGNFAGNSEKRGSHTEAQRHGERMEERNRMQPVALWK